MATLVTEKTPVAYCRSSVFAAFMVACTAFTCPGIFGALNGMGAGGSASDTISNAANAIVFGVIAVGSPFAGVICNSIGPKWTLVIGTLGYAPYAAGFYVVDHYGADWLLLFGAVIIGISACFLWVASGAIFLGYSEENRKGFAGMCPLIMLCLTPMPKIALRFDYRYSDRKESASLKFAMQNLGASIGGIISLALNIERAYRGSISQTTYIVLITIMCLGVPFAIALPKPSRVQRTDGHEVVIVKSPSVANEFLAFWALVTKPTVLALMPLMLYSQWFLSYQWEFNYAYFTVRSRAMNSMLFYLGGLVASLLLGQLLDWKRFSRPFRARVGFVIVTLTVGASWILGQVVQAYYSNTTPTLDFVETEYSLGCIVFLLWGISDPLVTTFLYWIIGSLTNHVNELTFLSALVNSVGSVGSTFGFVVSAMNFNYNGSCAINFALFVLAIPGLTWVVFGKITDTSHGIRLTFPVSASTDMEL